MSQINEYGNKCGLLPEEKSFLIKLSQQLKLPPARIIETIALNASPKAGDQGWEISKGTIDQYELRLDGFDKDLANVKRERSELQKSSGIIASFKKKFYAYEKDIETLEKTTARYNNILKILRSAQGHDELIEKLHKKSGFKTFDETLY